MIFPEYGGGRLPAPSSRAIEESVGQDGPRIDRPRLVPDDTAGRAGSGRGAERGRMAETRRSSDGA
eukprot:scaffold16149_cov94-Isochrysis_galbana.AAC.3